MLPFRGGDVLRSRRIVAGRLVKTRVGQRFPRDFAVGRLRQHVELNERARHHIVGQLFAAELRRCENPRRPLRATRGKRQGTRCRASTYARRRPRRARPDAVATSPQFLPARCESRAASLGRRAALRTRVDRLCESRLRLRCDSSVPAADLEKEIRYIARRSVAADSDNLRRRPRRRCTARRVRRAHSRRSASST